MSNEPIDRFITTEQATLLLGRIPLMPVACAIAVESERFPRFWHLLRALASARLGAADDTVIKALLMQVVEQWNALHDSDTAIIARMLGLPGLDPATSWVVDHLPCRE